MVRDMVDTVRLKLLAVEELTAMVEGSEQVAPFGAPVQVRVAVPLMIASTKWEVAVAMWTGRPRSWLITGTWMTPPPMPRKLETNPITRLSSTPGSIGTSYS